MSEINHYDFFGNQLQVGSWVALPGGWKTFRLGKITSMSPKMVRIDNGASIYPSSCILTVDEEFISYYLLKNAKSSKKR